MDRVFRSLEGKSSTLFLIAGALLVVFAGLLGYEALTGGTAPEDVFGPAGFAVGFVGLLGLYPSLAERSRWLARIGAVVAVIAAIGWTLLTIGSIAEVVGATSASAEETIYGAVGLGAAGLGMIFGYPAFSAASLRSGRYSRLLGLLLLGPTVIFVAVFAVLGPLGVSDDWGPFIAAAAQAAAHLAIGFALLRVTEVGNERPADVAAEAPRREGSRETVTAGRRN